MSDDSLSSASERARSKQHANQDLSELARKEEESPSETIRYTIDMPAERHQLLRRIAFEEDRSKKDVMLDALEMYAHKRGY